MWVCISLSLYCLEYAGLLESVNQEFSPNLISFQILFFWAPFLHPWPIPFLISFLQCQKVRPLVIVPQVPVVLFIFSPNLFSLCSSDWIISTDLALSLLTFSCVICTLLRPYIGYFFKFQILHIFSSKMPIWSFQRVYIFLPRISTFSFVSRMFVFNMLVVQVFSSIPSLPVLMNFSECSNSCFKYFAQSF